MRDRTLFVEGCASCHGQDARGHGPGPRPARRGRAVGRLLPAHRADALAVPGEEPLRTDPLYSEEEIQALVAYVASLGGRRIPKVDPAAGDLSEGERLFTLFCAGCHGKLAKGGVVTGAMAPSLDEATPVQVAEAIRIGPYVMPPFDDALIDQRQLDSIVAYVEKTQGPRQPRRLGPRRRRPDPRGDGGLLHRAAGAADRVAPARGARRREPRARAELAAAAFLGSRRRRASRRSSSTSSPTTPSSSGSPWGSRSWAWPAR